MKIFLDTNIFIHFKYFVDINWLMVSDDKKCNIVIAPVVIEELDKYKVGNDDRSKRARKVLQKIEEFAENQKTEIQNNVELKILIKKPNRSIFKANDLDPRDQDSQLIASIIQYQLQNKDEEIFLCTYDIGPRLRAKQLGIGILKLSDEYLLPIKESKGEKQLKTLIKENILLKSRIPKPVLVFENEKDFIKIKIDQKETNKSTFIQEKMEEIMEKFPHTIFDENRKVFNPFAPLASLSLISKEQIDQYNSQLDIFYSNYRGYLSTLYDFDIRDRLSVTIQLFLTNEGNTPAEEVDVYCYFPDGFDIIDEDDKENPPDEPNPPRTPTTLLESFSNINLRPLMSDLVHPTMPKLDRPTIKKTNSYEVHFSRKYVKHNTLYPLDTLIAIYSDYKNFNNFSIDYIIAAGNVPEPLRGKLNIIYEKHL